MLSECFHKLYRLSYITDTVIVGLEPTTLCFADKQKYLTAAASQLFLFNVFARINKRSILVESEYKSEEVIPLVCIANYLFCYMREYLSSEILALYPLSYTAKAVIGFEPMTSRLTGEVTDNDCIANLLSFCFRLHPTDQSLPWQRLLHYQSSHT